MYPPLNQVFRESPYFVRMHVSFLVFCMTFLFIPFILFVVRLRLPPLGKLALLTRALLDLYT